MQTWQIVFLGSFATAIATGLGALPFFFWKDISRHWLGLFNALAGGLMLGASVELVREGTGYSLGWTLAGVVVGIAFLAVFQRRFVHADDLLGKQDLKAINLRKMVFIVAMMALHSVAEGVSMGFAFGSGTSFGLLILAAMTLQNVPEGLAISLVLVPKGVKPAKAFWWSIVSSLPQPIMAVPAFLFVEAFRSFLPVGLGFAAGAMAWLIFSDLLPEAQLEAPGWQVAATVAGSLVLMFALGALAS